MMKCSSVLIRLILLMSYILMTPGCSELLDVAPPNNSIVGDQPFTNVYTARESIMGIFITMGSTPNPVCGGSSILTALYSGHAVPLGTNSDHQEFSSGFISPANGTLGTVFWMAPYKIISQINLCLEGINNSKGIPAPDKPQLTAECRFARALVYYHMINIFGAVPYITSTNYTVTQAQGRDNPDKVMDSVIADLRYAKKELPVQYPINYRVRANRYCAMALLARCYLQKRAWRLAEQECTGIINSGLYQLESLDSVFLINSKEAIFQLLPQNTSNYSMETMLIYPTNSLYPRIALSDSLLQHFESVDQRKSHWIKTVAIGQDTFYCPYKFKKRFGPSAGISLSELTTVIRLSEIFLSLAECRANQGDISGAAANLNIVRQRAGLVIVKPGTGTMGIDKMKNLIERERQFEFFTECGLNWFDLVRSGKVDVVMAQIKKEWDPRRLLWPIPKIDLEGNKNLTQNPGY